jgi:hypothetical protein
VEVKKRMSNLTEINHAAQINADAERKRAETKQAREQFIKDSTEQRNQKLNEAEAKMIEEKNRRQFLEKQSLGWESLEQIQLRLRMLQLGDSIQNISSSSSYVPDKEKRLETLKEDYNKLKAEYLSIPYKIGKEVFRAVPTYISQDGAEKIEFNGKNWVHYENSGAGIMGRTLKKIETDKDGLPSKLKGYFHSDETRRYFPDFDIPTETELILVEPNAVIEQPKTNKAEPLKFSWQCDVCKTVNQYGTMKCSRCGLDRKV